MVSSALNRLAPIDFTRYIDRLTERFTGREWLFEQIDRWLKQGNEQFYLLTGEPGVGKSAIAAKLTQIRSDIAAYHFCRAGDVETVRPGRVLRSLAAQLGKTLPHYGEALAKTIDPIHLRIDVNINIESLSNSQVTGIYIENLKESDPREELEILLRVPLAALPDLYAEHNEPLPTLKVLLIDSLDEAVTTTGRDNMATLLAALSQADGLPSWIRFILTARPDLRVLQQFKLMKLYKLEELLAQNLEDIERYVSDRVQELLVQPESGFQARLEQAQLSPETLVREVKDLSNGNFLYTRLLVDGIVAGELSLKNLSALPRTLNEVYQRFLRHRCPFRKWLNRYQPILGTLSVTQEAVSKERLVKFTGVDSKQIQDALGILQQFLDEVEDERGQKRYVIFHKSLREYLLDKKHNQDFWCDVKEQHDIIIGCFEKESESWQDLKAIDQYGLRYLAQHLVQADRVEELHTLLSLEKDGCNAWFDAKDEVAETAGFLADVQLAWSQADKAFNRESAKVIGLQCRYALIQASINSLAGIPTALMMALVKHQYWKPAKALAYARQIPDPKERCKSLAALADQLPNSEPLKPQVLQSALQAAQAIQNEESRAKALRTLADKPEALPKALDAALTIQNEQSRAKALRALADKLPEILPKALEAALAFHDESSRAEVLTALVDKLAPELLSKALDAALAFHDEYYRAKALTALVDKLTPESLSKALEATLAFHDESSRAEVLTALADKLTPESLPKALEAALAFHDEYYRAKALTTLADKLPPELLPKALEAALAFHDESSRAEVLTALAEKLIPGLLPKAIEAALAFQNEQYRAQALTALADKLTPELLPKALEAVLAFQNEQYRAQALTALADKLPEILPKALDAALDIQDNYSRFLALTPLAGKLPVALPKALEAALAVQDEYSRAEVLTALADKLTPELLPKAIEAALAFQNEQYRARTLTALADKLTPELLPKALEAVLAFQDNYSRTKVLRALADKLPETLPKALDAALAFEDESFRADVLTALVDKLTLELLPKALEATLAIQNESFRAHVLTALADKLPEILPKALEAALAIQNEYFRAHVLTALADKLTPELLPKALEAALAIPYNQYRAEALTALADKLTPDILPKSLEVALAIHDETFRGHALRALADKLPETLPKALEAALAIPFENERAQALTALADKLPAALPKAVEAALAVQDESSRVPALTALADKLDFGQRGDYCAMSKREY
jgi:plasmid stability protein